MGIPIEKTENIYWDALDITIYFGEDLDEELVEEFISLIRSWSILGFYQTFGNRVELLSDIWFEDREAGLTVECYSDEALEVLFLAIEGFADTMDIIIEKVVLGRELE